MSKFTKIAALGLAAGAALLPTAGAVFAANAVLEQTDNINITVNGACTFGSMTADGAYGSDNVTTHAHGNYTNAQNGTTGLGTWDDTSDTLSVAMQPGASSENIGSTTFTVRCNYTKGYTVKALADKSGKLVKEGQTDTYTANIMTGATWLGESATSAANGASYWNFKLSSDVAGLVQGNFGNASAIPTTTGGTVVVSKGTTGSMNGESFTVTYGAGIANAQETGTYKGSVTYTLANIAD